MPASNSAPRFDSHQPASAQTSEIKRKTPRKDTRAEMLLRRALWHRGARYKLHAKDLPGKPDLVFRRQKVAVFVDGDFWHGRNWPRERDKLAQRSNGSYWVAKIEYNRKRDQRNAELLSRQGWHVLRLWETDVKADIHEATEVVLAALRSRGRTDV